MKVNTGTHVCELCFRLEIMRVVEGFAESLGSVLISVAMETVTSKVGITNWLVIMGMNVLSSLIQLLVTKIV